MEGRKGRERKNQDKLISVHSFGLSAGSLATPKPPSCFYENNFLHLLTSFLNCLPKNHPSRPRLRGTDYYDETVN